MEFSSGCGKMRIVILYKLCFVCIKEKKSVFFVFLSSHLKCISLIFVLYLPPSSQPLGFQFPCVDIHQVPTKFLLQFYESVYLGANFAKV